MDHPYTSTTGPPTMTSPHPPPSSAPPSNRGVESSGGFSGAGPPAPALGGHCRLESTDSGIQMDSGFDSLTRLHAKSLPDHVQDSKPYVINKTSTKYPSTSLTKPRKDITNDKQPNVKSVDVRTMTQPNENDVKKITQSREDDVKQMTQPGEEDAKKMTQSSENELQKMTQSSEDDVRKTSSGTGSRAAGSNSSTVKAARSSASVSKTPSSKTGVNKNPGGSVSVSKHSSGQLSISRTVSNNPGSAKTMANNSIGSRSLSVNPAVSKSTNTSVNTSKTTLSNSTTISSVAKTTSSFSSVSKPTSSFSSVSKTTSSFSSVTKTSSSMSSSSRTISSTSSASKTTSGNASGSRTVSASPSTVRTINIQALGKSTKSEAEKENRSDVDTRKMFSSVTKHVEKPSPVVRPVAKRLQFNVGSSSKQVASGLKVSSGSVLSGTKTVELNSSSSRSISSSGHGGVHSATSVSSKSAVSSSEGSDYSLSTGVEVSSQDTSSVSSVLSHSSASVSAPSKGVKVSSTASVVSQSCGSVSSQTSASVSSHSSASISSPFSASVSPPASDFVSRVSNQEGKVSSPLTLLASTTPVISAHPPNALPSDSPMIVNKVGPGGVKSASSEGRHQTQRSQPVLVRSSAGIYKPGQPGTIVVKSPVSLEGFQKPKPTEPVLVRSLKSVEGPHQPERSQPVLVKTSKVHKPGQQGTVLVTSTSTEGFQKPRPAQPVLVKTLESQESVYKSGSSQPVPIVVKPSASQEAFSKSEHFQQGLVKSSESPDVFQKLKPSQQVLVAFSAPQEETQKPDLSHSGTAVVKPVSTSDGLKPVQSKAIVVKSSISLDGSHKLKPSKTVEVKSFSIQEEINQPELSQPSATGVESSKSSENTCKPIRVLPDPVKVKSSASSEWRNQRQMLSSSSDASVKSSRVDGSIKVIQDDSQQSVVPSGTRTNPQPKVVSVPVQIVNREEADSSVKYEPVTNNLIHQTQARGLPTEGEIGMKKSETHSFIQGQPSCSIKTSGITLQHPPQLTTTKMNVNQSASPKVISPTLSHVSGQPSSPSKTSETSVQHTQHLSIPGVNVSLSESPKISPSLSRISEQPSSLPKTSESLVQHTQHLSIPGANSSQSEFLKISPSLSQISEQSSSLPKTSESLIQRSQNLFISGVNVSQSPEVVSPKLSRVSVQSSSPPKTSGSPVQRPQHLLIPGVNASQSTKAISTNLSEVLGCAVVSSPTGQKTSVTVTRSRHVTPVFRSKLSPILPRLPRHARSPLSSSPAPSLLQPIVVKHEDGTGSDSSPHIPTSQSNSEPSHVNQRHVTSVSANGVVAGSPPKELLKLLEMTARVRGEREEGEGMGRGGEERKIPIVDVRKNVPWAERRKRMDSALLWLKGELECLRAMDSALVSQFQRCQDTIETLKQQQQGQLAGWGEGEGSEWGWGMEGSDFDFDEEDEAWEDWEIAEFEKKWAEGTSSKPASSPSKEVTVDDVISTITSPSRDTSRSPFTQDVEASL